MTLAAAADTSTENKGAEDISTAAQAHQRLAPVFARIAAEAPEQDNSRTLAHEAIAALKDAGFGALRVPAEFGGAGLTLGEFYPLVVALGAADSNVVQALRAHILWVEIVLALPAGAFRDRWLRRLAEGVIVGNATTETGNAQGAVATTLDRSGGRLVLNGTKFYSTGSLYADWIMVQATEEDGTVVNALIPADAPGLTLVDDWEGFGQRLTASGTTVLENVPVEEDEVLRGSDPAAPSHWQAYAQSVHLAALSGIAQAIVRDAVDYVRNRRRAFSHAAAGSPRQDPQVQQVIGQLAAAAYSAEATFTAVVRDLEKVSNLVSAGTATAEDYAAVDVRTYQAQLAITGQVLRAANHLFEVGGASAVGESRRLDRHWRNARVLAQHNPLMYRARLVGANLLNGDQTAVQYTVGQAS